MADVTVAEEEYLQTLFWLQEAGLPMTGANVARAMQLSPPTVHEMVGRLERDGYITRADDKSISFTDSGREHAEGDRPPPPAHRALPHRRPRASRGTRSTRRPSGSSTRCRRSSRSGCSPPSATRRPARTATRSSPARAIQGVPLADVEEGATLTVLRFENEAEELLHYLKATGLEPGPRGHARRAPRTSDVIVDAGDGARSRSTRTSPRPCRCVADPRRRRASRCPSSS